MKELAVVSAAASGIGAATVQVLMSRGWLVAALDRDPAGLARLGATWTIQGDARREESWVAVRDVVRAVEGIEHVGLVTAVGGAIFKSTKEMTDDDWASVLELNLLSAVRAVRVMLPELERAPTASIVTIGSLSGRRSEPTTPAYCAAKAALESWTSTLALELARTSVRVNCVVPGVTDTPGLHANLRYKKETTRDLEMRARLQPRGRLLAPAEVAEAVSFLLSRAASGLIGSRVVVDGGLSGRLSG